jgi:hypothetical protein
MLNSANSNLLNDRDAIRNNLLLGLSCETGCLFGDPYWGCQLKKFIYEQPTTLIQDLIIDAIYTFILEFMPQIQIERKNITIGVQSNNIFATLSYIIKTNGVSDMYTIKLTDSENF